MGLATPTSIMVGTGRAAELGVLFRQGDALQQLKHIQIIAFDKTGTLTQGHPSLTHIQTLSSQNTSGQDKPQYSEQDLIAIVAALQQQSEHPIAKAILTAAKEQNLTLPEATQFEAVKGFGITAQVHYQHQQTSKVMSVAVGSEALMQSLNLQTSTSNNEANNDSKTIEQWAKDGATPIHIAIDGQLVGYMAVTDPIKPEAARVIAHLQQQNIRCAMITGDHPLTAQSVAKALNLDIVHAQVKPEQKVQVIESLMQKDGPNPQKLAFVGDGINDAPALASADVGIAIGTGTDVAIEAASVVLMSGQLSKVITAIDVSKATLKNIHQNLFWAFAYNAALVPVAAGILYPLNGTLLSPMLAAGAMAFSSVFVVTNALRLRWIPSQ
jgi:heavy metal translocating P-type ATPase